MKTWGEIKNEALGLMFSNVNGSTKVPTSNADVQEYVINMADAANYAIRDLSTAVPILKYFSYSQKGQDADGVMRQELKYLTGDYRAAADETEEMLAAGVHVLGGYLITPKRGEIRVEIPYYAYAESVTAETDDAFQIDMLPECEDLIPIYMASRLYMEDDVQLATMYRNQYEAKKAELAANADLGKSGKFISVTGWW
jgi:hypothetical protein